jgi:signal transduction histidine kinase
LGVARPLIELHGGTLEIQSQNGGGVTVSAYFPKERLIAA